MTSYGTVDPLPATGFASARFFFKLSAPVLLATALLGFVMDIVGLGSLIPILQFDLAHNILHLVLALSGFYLGFGGASEGVAKVFAKILGVVYLGLAAIGFVSGSIFGLGSLLGLHIELGENLVHLGLGAYAAYVGFSQ